MSRNDCSFGIAAIAAALILALAAQPAVAQEVRRDMSLRAGDLIFFPVLGDEKRFYYLLDKPRLAEQNGKPQFSFVRYVREQGEGGAILTALVEIGPTDEQLRDAERKLASLLPGATVAGPLLYENGQFALITSFANAEEEKVIGIGPAPLTSGAKTAVSIPLSREDADVVWETFKSTAPDLTFAFNMTYSAFREPIRATVRADMDMIYNHTGFQAGAASKYLQGDIDLALQELEKSGAIKVVQVGADDDVTAAIREAKEQIKTFMFDPVSSIKELNGGQGGKHQNRLSGNAQQTLNQSPRSMVQAALAKSQAAACKPNGRGAARTEKTPGNAGTNKRPRKPPPKEKKKGRDGQKAVDAPGPGTETSPPKAAPADATAKQPAGCPSAGELDGGGFKAIAVFQMKRTEYSGEMTFEMNKWSRQNFTHSFTDNVGDLTSMIDDNDHFRTVYLDDPAVDVRQVRVILDGIAERDFLSYVNFVEVQLRKRHAGGAETVRGTTIDRVGFAEGGNVSEVHYGWKDDRSRFDWYEYQYRTTWNFHGGVVERSDWIDGDADTIVVAPPYELRSIRVDANPTELQTAGVRAASVRIFHEVAGRERVSQVVLDPGTGQLSEIARIYLPPDEWAYDYEIDWTVVGGETQSSGRRASRSALLSADPLFLGGQK